MEGGMIGLTIKSYNNVSINDLANRIIKGKYGEESKWWNRIANNLRAEQRIKPFFKKLIQEIKNPTQQMTDERINKLLGYFKDIIDKYPDEINYLITKAVHSANTNNNGKPVYNDDFSKAKQFFINQGKAEELKKIFKKLKKNKSGAVRQNTKYIPLQEKNTPNTVPQSVGQNTSAIVPDLVNKNNIDNYYEELIKQLNEIIYNEKLKNTNVIQKINIDNKTLILSHISNLANPIKKLVNIYKLSRFKNEEKANILIDKLSELISIYKLILSNNT